MNLQQFLMIKKSALDNLFGYSDVGLSLMNSNGAKGSVTFGNTGPKGELVKIVTTSRENPWTWKGRARQAGAIGMGLSGLGAGVAGGYYGGKILTDDILNMHESDSSAIRALRNIGLATTSLAGGGLGFLGGAAGAGYLMGGVKPKDLKEYTFFKDFVNKVREKGIMDNDKALYNLGTKMYMDDVPAAARNIIKAW